MQNIPTGKFFLGNFADAKTQNSTTTPILYDSANLTTHGVILGMTGSGKTGLSVNLLEEALHSGIPTVIIDPKGDMPNLTLQFPDLSPNDFYKWINKMDAEQRDMSPEEYAAMVARSWEFGLKKSGIEKERIKQLKEKVEFTIYTPGSDAGVSLNILDSFKVPPFSYEDNLEAFSEAVESTVQSLMGLVGIEADPLQSREFILLSNILQDRWKNGEDLTLESLIGYVMTPPVKKLGVFDVEMLFPQKDRMQLAMLLNNVIASPGFAAWIKGQPLNPEGWFNSKNGKVPCTIFYIAHLSDSERMFFVTLLLGKIMSYVRTLSGTSSLRALLYFDEVFGYLPPHPKNPPSKTPLLTILKQARAFGLGMVLATQNPVDLDYKALANAGTWFIGKMQTDRDRKRVLDGLDSSSFSSNRTEMDDLISRLETRNFILHSAHLKQPQVFRTRFAQAYLRGPVTRNQLKEMMEQTASQASSGAMKPSALPPLAPFNSPYVQQQQSGAAEKIKPEPDEEKAAEYEGYSPVKPDLPAGVNHYYLNPEALRNNDLRSIFKPFRESSDRILYMPALMARIRLRFDEEKARLVQYRELFRMIFPFTEDVMPVWPGEDTLLDKEMIGRKPESNALYAAVSPAATDKNEAKKIYNDLIEILYANEKMNIFSNKSLKMFSNMDEELRDFERRCAEEVESKMEREKVKIESKYQRKLDSLSRQIDRKAQQVEEAKQDLTMRRSTEALHVGESLLGMFTSKKKSIGHAISGAMTKHQMGDKAQQRIKQYELEIEHLRDEMNTVNREMDDAVEDTRRKYTDMVNDIEEIDVALEKSDISLTDFGVLWVPVSRV